MKTTCWISIGGLVAAGCTHVSAPPPAPLPGPMPARTPPPAAAETAAPISASLWAENPGSLLSMRRAKAVGDLLTVIVEMNDQASLQSSLSRSRDASEGLNLDAFFGLTEFLGDLLPGAAPLSPAIAMDRNSDANGSGAVNRREKVAFTLAARVIGVEPNGNLVIEGYQETRVSLEIRLLTVSGVIRTQDITRTNTVSYDKIADAQLTYISDGDASSASALKAASRLADRHVPF
jgi:flagellar L-ring protein FlgH